MALDPIVSLSVALAEAPGTCAFVLGSGVSRDAGVPTGWDITRSGLQRLRQLETGDTDELTGAQLSDWLRETDREHLTYSDLLELIAPDAAVRREYLAGFFEGREPGATHEALADLAVQGMVRVFVTTNFDRLLERALQARGIEPIVAASDGDLDAAVPREHAGCVVVKPHGDYLRQTIRNTPDELAELEPSMTAELKEIFDRYGVVVLGYSGSDPAIAAALSARRSRYGLWWVARGELSPAAQNLVDAVGGRTVRRDSAAAFLTDLRRRLAVFAEHPTGQTPRVIHDETLALLRSGDAIGLDEHLRAERNWYEKEIERVAADAGGGHPSDVDHVARVWSAATPVLERRLAGLIPLALHSAETFAVEVAGLARGMERRPLAGGYTAWTGFCRYAATWLGYACGALIMRLERLGSLAPLLQQQWIDRHGHPEQLVWLPSETGHLLGQTLVEGNWISPSWEHLAASVGAIDWLLELYPELNGEDEPRRSLAQFDFVSCIHLLLKEHRAVSFYSLGSGGAEDLALRLNRDDTIRAQIAAACGVTLEDFDARVVAALADVTGLQGGITDPHRAPRLLAGDQT